MFKHQKIIAIVMALILFISIVPITSFANGNSNKPATIEPERESENVRIIMTTAKILWKTYKTFLKVKEAQVEAAIEKKYGTIYNRYTDLRSIKLENTKKTIVLEHGTSDWGMEHILSKHHPKYWTGLGYKSKNSFFPENFSFTDIENVIITVANYGNNDKTILNYGFGYGKKTSVKGYYC